MGSRKSIVILLASIVIIAVLFATGFSLIKIIQYNVGYSTEEFVDELKHRNINIGTPLSELTGYTGYGGPSITVERPRRILANGSEIAIYEFEEADYADEIAKTISPDGQRVGLSFISWISKPHFYKKGKIIIQYVGEDLEILERLGDILGKPIASGK